MENRLSEKTRNAILAQHSQRAKEVIKAGEQLGRVLRPIVADITREVKAQRFSSITSQPAKENR